MSHDKNVVTKICNPTTSVRIESGPSCWNERLYANLIAYLAAQ